MTGGGVDGPEWPDLRLAGCAVACWLAALTGLYLPAAGSALIASAAGVLAAIATWTAAALRRGPGSALVVRLTWLAAAIFLGTVCGAVSVAARVAVRDAEPVAGLARHHVSVTADVLITDDPRPVRSTRGPVTYAVPARLVRLDAGTQGGVRVSAGVLVLASAPEWRGLLPGQRVTVSGRMGPPRPGDLRAAVLSTALAPQRISAPPLVQRAAGTLRAGLREASRPLPADVGGLLPGLVVGDTSRLDPDLADAFRATGMTHLVAVSGSNCAVVVAAVLLLVRWCRAGPAVSALLCAVGLVGFVILARPSPSVLRAAVMGGLALVALALGRPRAAVPALAASVVLLLVVDPSLAADAGFALSVLATAGLLLLAPGWSAALRARRVPAAVAEALAVPGAAQVACAPVIAAISATISLTAVPANLLAVPAVGPATVLGIVAALLSPWWMTGAQFVAWLASWPARWLVWLAETGAAAPAGLLPWPGGPAGGLLLAAILLGILWIGTISVLRRLALVIILAAAVGAVPVRLVGSGWPPVGWFVVACDVGQGDAVVLADGVGHTVLVDTGPDPSGVERCLRRLGVARIALLIITHFHADHVGGIEGALRGRAVTAIVTTAFGEPAAGQAAVRVAADAHRVPMAVSHVGVSYAVGALRLTVIGPEQTMTGTRSDPNNNSLVVRATLGRHTVLLAGDAETEEQHTLLGAPIRADVLKVAHHGSAYQDPAFLAAADPSVALVSVGLGNDYGHPNAAVLASLRRVGVRVLRTDLQGDLAVVDDHDGLAVVTRGPDPGRRQ